MRDAQLRVEPAIHQLLQACLAAKMFGGGVMRQHVFPGIDLQHLAFRGLGMRAKGLAPGKPQVVNRPFLLAADIAIKSLSPGQWRHPILRWDFLHEGRLHQCMGAISHFLSEKRPKLPYFIDRKARISLLHSHPQEFHKLFVIRSSSSNNRRLRLSRKYAVKPNF